MSREAVDAGHQAFLAAMKANDAEALGRTLAENALFMPPNEPNVAGRQAAVAWFDGITKQARTTDVTVFDRQVSVAGELGMERGSFIWTLELPDGSRVENHGRFLAIWRRQADATWKLTENIWNSSIPQSTS